MTAVEQNPGLVDVVLTTNRLSPYLAQTLDALTAQTYPHWRLIVVDDGSNCPGDIEQAVAGLPGTIVIHQAASGLPAGRNAGLARATGEFVVFMDDDDISHPDRFRRQVEALTRAPDALSSCTGGWFMDETGEPTGAQWSGEQQSRADVLSGRVELPRIVTVMARRQACVELGGFDPTLSLCEDHYFTLMLLARGEMVSIDDRLVGYRIHSRNMSKASLRDHLDANRRLYALLLARVGRSDDPAVAALLRRRARRYRVRTAHAGAAHVAHMLRTGRAPDGMDYLARCFRLAPLATLGGVIWLPIGAAARRMRRGGS